MSSFSVINGETQSIDHTFVGEIDNISIQDGTFNIVNSSDEGLLLLFAESARIDVESFGQFNVLGKLIEVGVSDGTLGQSFSDWQSSDQIGTIWIEDSEESDTYSKWTAINPPEITSKEFADFADHKEVGKVFKWINGIITFTDTAGSSSVPPSGCRIMVPNIVFTSVGGFSDLGSASFIYDGGGKISLSGCSFSDFKATLRGMEKISFLTVGIFSSTYLTYCNDIILNDVGVAPLTTTAAGVTVSYSASTKLINIKSISYKSSGIVVSYSKNIEGKNIVGITMQRDSTTDSALWLKVVSNSTLYNVTAIGGRLFLDECSNNKISGVSLVDKVSMIEGTAYSSPNLDLETSPNNKLENISVPLGGGSAVAYIRAKNSPGCDYIDMDFLSSQANNVVSLDTCFDNRLVGMFFKGYRSSTPFLISAKNNGLLLQNIDAEIGYSFLVESVNTEVKGIFLSALNTDFVGIENFFMSQIYTSETEGIVRFIMARDTLNSHYSILSGSPKWTNAGRVYLRSIGDSIEFASPWKLKGVVLQDMPPVITGVGYGDMNIEYAVDEKPFTSFSQENLALEDIDPLEGFNIKFRITATIDSPNSYISDISFLTLDNRFIYPMDFELGRIVFDEIFADDPGATYALMLSSTHGDSLSEIVNDGDGVPIFGVVDGKTFVDFTFDYKGNNQADRILGEPTVMTLVVSGLASAQTVYIEQTFIDEGTNVFNARTEQELSYAEAL